MGSLMTCNEQRYTKQYRWSSVQTYLVNHRDPRLLFDLGAQVGNSLIILGMAYERYILVCWASDVKTILTRTRRFALYCAVIALIAFCWSFLIWDFFDPGYFSSQLSRRGPEVFAIFSFMEKTAICESLAHIEPERYFNFSELTNDLLSKFS